MYQTDFPSDNIRICAAEAASAPFVWYEEPIVIEPEKNIRLLFMLSGLKVLNFGWVICPKPLSVCAKNTELVSTESFLPIFTFTIFSFWPNAAVRTSPNEGTYAAVFVTNFT